MNCIAIPENITRILVCSYFNTFPPLCQCWSSSGDFTDIISSNFLWSTEAKNFSLRWGLLLVLHSRSLGPLHQRYQLENGDSWNSYFVYHPSKRVIKQSNIAKLTDVFRPYICVIFGAPLQCPEIRSLRTQLHLEGRTNSNSNQDWDVFLTHASGKFSASAYKTPSWKIFWNPLAFPPRLPSNGCILLLLKLHQVGNGFLLPKQTCFKYTRILYQISIWCLVVKSKHLQQMFGGGSSSSMVFSLQNMAKDRNNNLKCLELTMFQDQKTQVPVLPGFGVGISHLNFLEELLLWKSSACKWIWNILFTLQFCRVCISFVISIKWNLIWNSEVVKHGLSSWFLGAVSSRRPAVFSWSTLKGKMSCFRRTCK